VFLRQPLPKAVLDKPLLFDFPTVREESGGTASDGKFRVNLVGEFAAGEEYWELAAEATNWILEVRASQNNGDVLFGVAPTKRTRKDNPDARNFTTSIPHPDPVNGPFFDARILIREGRRKMNQDQRVWANRSSGIRVYLEGFRVLPYGEPMDDWLKIDYEYTRRARQLDLLREMMIETDGTDPEEGLIRLPQNNYHGAVFLTHDRAPSLRILVNREGFVPEAGFDTLEKLMRTGVDLSTRVRAAAAYASRLNRKKERSGRGVAGNENFGTDSIRGTRGRADEGAELPDRIEETGKLIHQARTRLSEGNVVGAQETVNIAANRFEELKADVISERALLRVLASVGAQMAAFVHEINALLGSAQTVEQALSGLIKDKTLSTEQRRRLQVTLTAATELKRGLERHASYLTDVVTPDARRRRSRQSLFDRFQAAIRLVQHQAERRRIDIINEIPPDLKSPPMFPAELTTVFANLLTNAVKGAGKNGKIHAGGKDGEEDLLVRIQNTGIAVDLAEAERWFKPFESTTSEINPVLGQGMGLGLTITRTVLESYGSTIVFAQPDSGYATAIEISFPK